MPALKKLTVEVAEDDVSGKTAPCTNHRPFAHTFVEWENSDDAFSSSEVMESVTELGAVADLNDPDVQL